MAFKFILKILGSCTGNSLNQGAFSPCLSIHCYTVAKYCQALCILLDYSIPGFPGLWYLLILLNSCPLCECCHLTISSSAAPFCLQSFPASGSFPMSQCFASGGQSIEASASLLPINIQDWFALGLTGLISMLSKGLYRVCSGTTTWKHEFIWCSAFIDPTLTSIYDYWKNHSFDYTDLCWQSDVSAF